MQGKIKKLLKGKTEICAEILENTHPNYCTLKTGELMRDAASLSYNFLLSRLVPKEDSGKKVSSIPHTMNTFPHNIRNLLPRKYYSQFREWYSHMVIPEPLRSDSSRQWLLKFRFMALN